MQGENGDDLLSAIFSYSHSQGSGNKIDTGGVAFANKKQYNSGQLNERNEICLHNDPQQTGLQGITI